MGRFFCAFLDTACVELGFLFIADSQAGELWLCQLLRRIT